MHPQFDDFYFRYFFFCNLLYRFGAISIDFIIFSSSFSFVFLNKNQGKIHRNVCICVLGSIVVSFVWYVQYLNISNDDEAWKGNAWTLNNITNFFLFYFFFAPKTQISIRLAAKLLHFYLFWYKNLHLNSTFFFKSGILKLNFICTNRIMYTNKLTE